MLAVLCLSSSRFCPYKATGRNAVRAELALVNCTADALASLAKHCNRPRAGSRCCFFFGAQKSPTRQVLKRLTRARRLEAPAITRLQRTTIVERFSHRNLSFFYDNKFFCFTPERKTSTEAHNNETT